MVVSDCGVQLIMTSKGVMSSSGEAEDINRVDVGFTRMGSALGPVEALVSVDMSSGRSCSLVERRSGLLVQKRVGVRPWDQASWSSAAPWM